LALSVDPRTVRYNLNRMGLSGRRPRRKPLLTKKHKKARLEFAQEYKSWTGLDWADVYFSDETNINLFSSDGMQWVWRREGEELLEECVAPTVKYGGGKVVLWGGMAKYVPAELHFIEGNMNADKYLEILNNYMLPSALRIVGKDFIYLEDNDPKHGGPRGSLKVRKWFKTKKVSRIPFPPQSPDLNPIEHLWGSLKIRVNERRPRSIEELKKFISEEFFATDRTFIEKLINSMPARLKAVIKARGGYTKY